MEKTSLEDIPVGIALFDNGKITNSNKLWNELVGKISYPDEWTSKITNVTVAFTVNTNLKKNLAFEEEFFIGVKSILFYYKNGIGVLLERKDDPVQTLLLKLLRNQLSSIQSKNGLVLIRDLKNQLAKFSDYLPTDALRDAENMVTFKANTKTDVIRFKLNDISPNFKSETEYVGDLPRLRQIIDNIQTAGFLVSNVIPTLTLTEKPDLVNFAFSPIFFSANTKAIASKRLDSSSIRLYTALDEIGIHLFIAKALVETLGVTLDLSEQDTLSFSLKLSKYSQELPTTVVKQLKKDLVILIVEDNFLNRKILKRFLESKGEKVVEATDGNMAFDIYSKKKIDMIFMDIELPFMNGIDTTIKIREAEDTQNLPPIPIVALSGIFVKDYKEKSIKAGMSAFLEKPYVFTEITQTIQNFFKTE